MPGTVLWPPHPRAHKSYAHTDTLPWSLLGYKLSKGVANINTRCQLVRDNGRPDRL